MGAVVAESLLDGAPQFLAVAWDEQDQFVGEADDVLDVGVLRFYQRLGFRLLRVERDAFTADAGYPEIEIDGIPLRDRVWLSLSLGDAAMPADS